MDKDHIVKRLSLVKFLYKLGMEQSRQSETTSFFSILSFHDSIDMFLNLAAEKIGIERKKGEKIFFMDYWTKIPSLTLKESMNKLNDRRVNLKHKGLIPGRIDVEASRVNTTEFFEQNTPTLFGINFNEVSLFDLVKFEKTKFYLVRAQNNLDTSKTNECIEEVTKAFYELLHEYKENKRGWGADYKTHFKFIEKIKFEKQRNYNSTNQVIHSLEKSVEKSIEQVNKNFNQIDTALEVISLGIDYRKYTKFKILTPHSFRHIDGQYHLEVYGEKNWSTENCQFLIDFVLESALKLQDFDYDYESLDTTKPLIRIK